MSETKISDLSTILKLDNSEILALLEKAGIESKTIDDTLNDNEKKLLLSTLSIKTATNTSKVRLNLKLSPSLAKSAGEKTIRKVPIAAVNRSILSSNRSAKISDKKIPSNQKRGESIDINQIKDRLAQEKFSQTMLAKENAIANKSQASEIQKIKESETKVDQEKEENNQVKEVKVFNPPSSAPQKTEKKEPNFDSTKNPFNTQETSLSESELRKNLEKKRQEQEKNRAKMREQTKERLRQAINRVKDGITGSQGGIENTHKFEKPVAPVVYEVKLTPTISVSDLAKEMAVKQSAVIEVLMNLDIPVTANQSISKEVAIIVIEELGHTYQLIEDSKEEDLFIEDKEFEKLPRSPVITIMGHVDHGKTTLLDAIRKTKVTSTEAGGITQHIGAYQVKSKNNQLITFLDTPGHEAFSEMRARGANITDIIVLVVAADDSVMPRTIESIQHAKAAKVPIIVAVNKIDKPEANIEKVTQDLSHHGVLPESWGGENLFVNVSAINSQGIDELLDAIMLQAEMLDLKAEVKGRARGVVVESRMEKGKGAVVTALITKGTLKRGDVVLAGLRYGRIRLMTDDSGKLIKQALPSTPVEILGLSGVCDAGDDLVVFDKEKEVKEAALKRQQNERENRLEKQQTATLNSFLDRMSGDDSVEQQKHNILVKADVSGSVEAICSELIKLSNDEVSISIVASGVGAISETDVNLAIASKAAIVGFNVRADSKARKIIEKEGINLKYYSIIYELLDDITAVVKGLKKDEFKDEIIGIAEVRDVFRSPKMGDIAGCMVIEGLVKRSQPIRVLREKVVIYEGELESLRRIKEDVQEVKKGIECGIGVKNYNDIKVGDQIEVYQRIKVNRQ